MLCKVPAILFSSSEQPSVYCSDVVTHTSHEGCQGGYHLGPLLASCGLFPPQVLQDLFQALTPL